MRRGNGARPYVRHQERHTVRGLNRKRNRRIVTDEDIRVAGLDYRLPGALNHNVCPVNLVHTKQTARFDVHCSCNVAPAGSLVSV